jgi:hypothetical protein
MRTGIGCLLAVLTIGLVSASGEVAGVDSIKVIMSKAHKDPLLLKVCKGKANAAEKQQLVALYRALSRNKPPKRELKEGELKEWKERTEAMVKAALAVAAGEKDAEKELTKLTNCRSCHEVFK